MQYINIDQFVAGVQDDLAFKRNIRKGTLIRWTYFALSELEEHMSHSKQVDLPLVDCKVMKPADLVAVDSIFLVDGNNCVEPFSDKIVFCCDIPKRCGKTYRVEENLDFYLFSSNVKDKFDTVRIKYYAIPLDENGRPMVPLQAAESAYRYIRLKYLEMLREKDRSKAARSNSVPVSEIRLAEVRWFNARRGYNGETAKPTSFRNLLEQMDKVTYDISNSFPPTLAKCCSSFYLSSWG